MGMVKESMGWEFGAKKVFVLRSSRLEPQWTSVLPPGCQTRGLTASWRVQLPNPNHPRLPVAVGSCAGASWRDLHYNLVSEFGLGKKITTINLAPSSLVWWQRALNVDALVFPRQSAIFCFILKASWRKDSLLEGCYSHLSASWMKLRGSVILWGHEPGQGRAEAKPGVWNLQCSFSHHLSTLAEGRPEPGGGNTLSAVLLLAI